MIKVNPKNVKSKNVKYEKHWIWEQNFNNYVTGVITLDTEDYFKKERIWDGNYNSNFYSFSIMHDIYTYVTLSLSLLHDGA